MTEARRYVRDNNEHSETVWVHVDNEGHVRMTAANLHEVLTHIGFTRVDTNKETA